MPNNLNIRQNEMTAEIKTLEIPYPDNLETSFTRSIDTDVIVIGAGISGMSAAVSSAEAKARTVLLEKGPSFNYRGLHNAAISSALQNKAGIKNDRDKIISTIMEWGGFKADQKVVTVWANNCSEVFKWLSSKAKAANIDVHLDPMTKSWYFPNFAVAHIFWTPEPDRPKAQEALAGMLFNNAKALQVDIHFNTPAIQLLRNPDGRVGSVVARPKDGGYLRFNASRGVILCTGDYGGDPQMIQQYCVQPDLLNSLKREYEGGLNTGDGHKMAIQIGADIDDPPHMPMVFDFAAFSRHGLFNLGRQPWLYVNSRGERFMNEDLPWGFECNQILRQPDHFAWSIWDAKYDQEWPKMKSQCCKNMGPPLYRWGSQYLEKELKKDNVLAASTIGELAQKMAVPAENFKATVTRYTELAKGKKDLDFGKHPDRLTTVEKTPYYACKIEARLMVILGGLKINTRLQVLDTNGTAIEGLYAAGNVSGSFFGSGNAYPTTLPGLTHSRAWTFGRLAGLNAASF